MSDFLPNAEPRGFAVAPSVPCESCNNFSPFDPTDGNPVQAYLSGSAPRCIHCGTPVDLWRACVDHLEVFESGMIGSLPLGAHNLLCQFQLRRDELTVLDLHERGLPKDARVIHINYTPQEQGWLFPTECHGNVPYRQAIPSVLYIYGRRHGGGPHAESARCSVSVTWVRGSVDPAVSSLVAAFGEYAAERYESCIVPANVALEVTLERSMTGWLEALAVPKQRRVELLRELTYGFQLDPILGIAARLVGVPPLRQEILEALRALKKARDDLAHPRERVPDAKTASKLLCAAVFGIQYVVLVNSAVADRLAATQQSLEPPR